MNPLISIDDDDWPEVENINSYAIFMAYLLMCVRGLGFLVLTWTTVVLLGGFVSMLQKKDFWCLTVITLVQTAGVFDFLLKEKASDIWKSFTGLLAAINAAVLRPLNKDKNKSVSNIRKGKRPLGARRRFALAYVLLFLHMLVLAIALCILSTLYMLGLYISSAISLWRLVQHDYSGGNNTDGVTNLKPALNVLYSLTLVQGVVYSYRSMYDWVATNGLVEGVADEYSLEKDIVSDYLDETLTGCMKDPSFVKGRNLVTYAVDLLIEPKTRYSYICGVLILGKTLQWSYDSPIQHGQSSFIKQLLTRSIAFHQVVQQLVEKFGSASPYNTDIRECAAWIVANVAGHIHLQQLPDGTMIQYISTLVDSFEDYSWRPEGYKRSRSVPKECERDWLLEDRAERKYLRIDRIPPTHESDDSGNNLVQGYKRLVVQGLRIIQKLIINDNNGRVIINNEGLLHKTIAPLISDQLRKHHHDDEWCSIAFKIVVESIELMQRLMASPGETNTKMIKLISEKPDIRQAIDSILECPKCETTLKRQSVVVLLDLSVGPSSIVSTAGRSGRMIVIFILLHIYLLPESLFDGMCGCIHWVNKSSDYTRLAGEHLLHLLRDEGAESLLAAVRMAFRNLTSSVINGPQNNTYDRIHAATVLRHLLFFLKDRHLFVCTNCDEYINEVEKAATDVIPEVFKEIVRWLKREEEIQVVTMPNNGDQIPEIQAVEPSSDGIKLHEALISLCYTAFSEDYIIGDQDSTPTAAFNKMSAKICSEQGMPVKKFKSLVQEARDKLKEEKERFKSGGSVPANS